MTTYHERLKLIKLGQLPKEAIPKPKKYLAKQSVKKKQEIKEQRDGGDSKLDNWFEDRRKEMTGRCQLCNGKSEKNNDETYRRSIHHILDKRPAMFPSVAIHPDNWIEVCFWGNSCHTNLTNGIITIDLILDSKEGKIILDKFKRIFPFIADKEKKNIPDVLLKELRARLEETVYEPDFDSIAEFFKEFDLVRFRNGYAKNSKSIDVECKGISVGHGREKWGGGYSNVYVIKLGKINRITGLHHQHI